MTLKTIDAKTLKIWLDSEQAILLDVREPAENEAQSIKGAVLMPLASVSKEALPNCAGKKLVIHCRKGGRGGTACEKLLAEDANLEIYNLEGGIEAWEAAGFTTESTGRKILPLDRQVQLTIGVCLLVSSLLGYFISPNFFLLTGLFGAGLTFAGLTGFCGLAILMAKMPWNQATKEVKSCCMVKHYSRSE